MFIVIIVDIRSETCSFAHAPKVPKTGNSGSICALKFPESFPPTTSHWLRSLLTTKPLPLMPFVPRETRSPIPRLITQRSPPRPPLQPRRDLPNRPGRWSRRRGPAAIAAHLQVETGRQFSVPLLILLLLRLILIIFLLLLLRRPKCWCPCQVGVKRTLTGESLASTTPRVRQSASEKRSRARVERRRENVQE